ncbi:hypothetical protein Tco_0709147 [Tanacetum coccineum]
MHNNIMAASSRDHPPMLTTGRYAQWKSRFMRYIDTRPNGEALKKCILQGPYKLSHIIIPGQLAIDESLEVPERMATAHDMWIAIERLHQGESLNKQDVKTSLFWEFSKFTSRDGESIESYYSRKPKRAKDYTYHKEKMLLCKHAEKGVPLKAEQANWLEDTDEEIDEQELEAHYSFMANIQEVLPAESGSDAEPLEKQPESINDTHVVEKDDSNVIPDSSNMCDNDNQADQNAEECDDERVVLANLIANLKLDSDKNKKIQKQLKKANTSLSHELQQCKSALEECKSHLGESNRTRDRYLGALHDKKVELEMYKVFKDRTKRHS